jgi:hypothetical protein
MLAKAHRMVTIRYPVRVMLLQTFACGMRCQSWMPGTIRRRNPLPTNLPQPRRPGKKHLPAQTVFNVLFNTTLVVSALVLMLIVLVREEQFSLAHPEDMAQTIDRIAEQGRWP